MSKRLILTITAFTMVVLALIFSFKVRILEKTEVDLLKALLLTAGTYVVGETWRKSGK